jgi:hypothetical protein
MDWSKALELGLLTMYALGFLLVLFQAARRREWKPLFEVFPLGVIGVFLIVADLLRGIQTSFPWYVRGLLFVAVALVVANWFGFSRWLFGRGRTSAT